MNFPPRQKAYFPAPSAETESLPLFFKLSLFLVTALSFIGFRSSLLIAVILYIPSRLVTIPVRAIVLFAALTLILAAISKSSIKLPKLHWIHLTLFVVAFGVVLRVLYTTVLQRIEFVDEPRTLLLIFLGGGIIPLAALALKYPLEAYRWAYWGLVSAGIVGAITGTYLYRNLLIGGGGRMRMGEFYGEFVGTNPLAIAYMGSAVMVLAMALLTAKVKESRFRIKNYLFPAFLFIISIPPLIIGASRGPLVAILGCALVLIITNLRKNQILTTFTLTVLAVLGGLFTYFVAQEFGGTVFTRFFRIREDIQVGADSASRIVIWQMTIAGFLSSPLLGGGLSPTGGTGHAHNVILESFYALGIFGGSAFTVLITYITYLSIIIIRHFPTFNWIGIIYLHYLIGAMFSSTMVTNYSLWCGIGLVLGFAFSMKLTQRGWKVQRANVHQNHKPLGQAAFNFQHPAHAHNRANQRREPIHQYRK